MDADLAERVEKLAQSMLDYAHDLRRALQYIAEDAESALAKCRLCSDRLLEEIAEQYRRDLPQKGNPLDDPVIAGALGRSLLGRMRLIREFGNHAAHAGRNKEPLWPEDAELALSLLCDVLERWEQQSPRRAVRRRTPTTGEPDDSHSHRSAVDSGGPRRVVPAPPPSSSRGWLLAGGSVLVIGLVALGIWTLRPGARPQPEGLTAQQPPPVPTVAAEPRPAISPLAPSPPRPAPPLEKELPPPVAGPADVTWTAQRSEVTTDLNAVISDASGQLFAAGDHGVVIASRDGGQHWQRLPADTRSALYALGTTSAGRVFAVGEQGTLLLPAAQPARPGASAWEVLAVADKSNLRAACSHPSGDLFVAGDLGVIAQLTANGRPRKLTRIINHPNLRAITVADAQTVYAAGDSGVVLRGRYAGTGTDWQTVASGELGTLWALFHDRNRLLVGGESSKMHLGRPLKEGIILRHGDGGFSRMPLLGGPSNPIYGFAHAASGEIYAAVFSVERPYLLQSVDGATWRRSPIDNATEGLRKARYAISASPLGDLTIVGPKGLILHKRTATARAAATPVEADGIRHE